MKKLTKKQIEQKTTELYQKYAYGIQFNVMDLGKVLNQIRQALSAGHDGVEATKQAIETYKVK